MQAMFWLCWVHPVNLKEVGMFSVKSLIRIWFLLTLPSCMGFGYGAYFQIVVGRSLALVRYNVTFY
jgi:hypothetical protein